MVPLQVTFGVPLPIAQGVAKGAYEIAAGGVVRQVANKQVVMWLRPIVEETGKQVVRKAAVGVVPLVGVLPVAAPFAIGLAAGAGLTYLALRWNQNRKRRRQSEVEAKAGIALTPVPGRQTDLHSPANDPGPVPTQAEPELRRHA